MLDWKWVESGICLFVFKLFSVDIWILIIIIFNAMKLDELIEEGWVEENWNWKTGLLLQC